MVRQNLANAHPVALARAYKGMSQEALARKANLSARTVFRLEARQTSPNIQTLGKIAVALGVPITQLIEILPDGDES